MLFLIRNVCLCLLLVPSFSEKIKSKSIFIEVHYSLPQISHSSLVERPNTGIPHYVFLVIRERFVNKPQRTCAWVYFEWIERAFFRSPLKAIIFFLYKNVNVNYLVAHPYPLQGIPWRATGGSPFECVDISKYTQGIRRNVWKLRMERRMIKVLTHLGLKFSSKKMFPATSTYQVCCLPYSNKFASIWRENVTHINAGEKETKIVFWRLLCSSYNSAERYFS